MSDEWHLHDDGQQYGPFSKSEIAAMIAEGRVSAAAQVWREGMAGWVPVATIVPPEPVQSPIQPKPLRRSKKSSSKPIYIGAIAVGILALVFVVWKVFSSVGGSSVGGSSNHPDVGIEPVQAGTGGIQYEFRGWVITNKDQAPLTIQRVVYNGEHVARLGRIVLGDPEIFCAGENKPIRLTIGDSQAYFQTNPLKDGLAPYWKEIIFIDVYTDRGDFRFRPPFTFGSETPRFDEAAVKASEDEMAARVADWRSRNIQSPEAAAAAAAARANAHH